MSDTEQNSKKTNMPVEENMAWPLLEKLILELLQEQKSSRRWKIFFRGIIFLFFCSMFIIMYESIKTEVGTLGAEDAHTAMVQIKGTIGDDVEASAKRVVEGLRAAYDNKKTKGIILRINSPGGSPVQAAYIHDEVQRLKLLNPEIPVYSVIVDIGVSGGYYVAVAADAIYADKASLVGSIGVISSGFGFVEAMKNFGISRRVYHSGEKKALMDPFLPEDKEVMMEWQSSLNAVHQQFIHVVKNGRGDKLSNDEQLFTGMIWTGEGAMALGLVDELGNVDFVAREVIGVDKVVDFTPKKNLERVMRELGLGAISSIVQFMDFQFR